MTQKALIAIQAGRELGLKGVWLYALYQAGLRSGYYRLRTPHRPFPPERAPSLHLEAIPLPSAERLQRLLAGKADEITAEADEIVRGRLRLFGGEWGELQLAPPVKPVHWSRRHAPSGDVKLLWEPARFGWVFALGRAYLLTDDERYPQAFWQRWEEFQDANPVNRGPNWESGQEVALRLIALGWAARLFADSAQTTAGRKARLTASLIDHARRIPPTLIYARAQNNNHLVSEAAGLYAAGILLTGLPEAQRWKSLGRRWLNRALQSQIEEDGEYAQHSTNYQRMVLQLALFAEALARRTGEFLPSATMERLGAATLWLLAHFDPNSGRAANLGHNDGSNPLPLAAAEFTDYRPVLQAASLAFLGRPVLKPGGWDEYPAWLDLPETTALMTNRYPIPWRIERLNEWAILRARRYSTRPAHADQLHVDLWFKGHNILMDAGTYSYNAPPPWENGLVSAGVHNSLTLDGEEPMRRAGRFLWLEWDQAEPDPAETVPGQRLTAWREGYARLGWRHRRRLEWLAPGRWQVTDELQALRPITGAHQAVLHWLLPDGEWLLEGQTLVLTLPETQLSVAIEWTPEGVIGTWLRLVRGGEVVFGPPDKCDKLGWYSFTYMSRVPALSFQVGFEFSQPVTIKTGIHLESRLAKKWNSA